MRIHFIIIGLLLLTLKGCFVSAGKTPFDVANKVTSHLQLSLTPSFDNQRGKDEILGCDLLTPRHWCFNKETRDLLVANVGQNA